MPTLDYLEDRIALSSVTVGAGDTPGLINAINQANSGDTISLTNSTYTIAQTNNTTNGSNALPVIATNLTINGNGATINGANFGRLFDIAPGKVVTLENLTLTGGRAAGINGQGGAIYDAGSSLTLNGVNLAKNAAYATGQTTNGAGNSAQGGGLYISGGTVQLTNCNITNNIVSASSGIAGAAGGNAQGGGIYANGASLIISGGTINNQTIEAGKGGAGTANHPTGGAGGDAQGGGIYIQGGSLKLSNGASVSVNTVNSTNFGLGGAGNAGGAGGVGGNAEGGGVFASNATVVITGGASINNNTMQGGFGGAGNAAGLGGAGGQGLGGGLFVEGGSAAISGSAYVNLNGVNGGIGGLGGSAGAGGVGGAAEGGGIYVLAAPLTLTSGTSTFVAFDQAPGINGNTLFGGSGGHGGGGNGGAGGVAQGGGVFASGANFAVKLGDANHAAAVDGNTTVGGNGGTAGGIGIGGNGGLASGGAVSVLGGPLTLTNATLYGNTGRGGNGGNGGNGRNGTAVVTSKSNLPIISNFGNGGNVQGGGLFVSGSSSVTVLNSTLVNNTNEAGGGSAGGVARSSTSSVKYGVGGTVQGGGLYATSSTVKVLNSTFANNFLEAGAGSNPTSNRKHSNTGGTAQGGGLYAANGSLSLTNDTIAWDYLTTWTDRGEIVGQGSGVFYNASPNNLQLENTIIALNQLFTNYAYGEESGSQYDLPSDLYGTAASSDHDLIGDGSGSNLSNGTYGDQVGSDASPLNPDFAPAVLSKDMNTKDPNGKEVILNFQVPDNYGGLTYTMPLAATSPALNAGDPSAATAIAAAEGVSTANATDQRGMARVVNGAIDIGATQSGTGAPQANLLLTGTAPATVPAGQDITYTITVSNNGSGSASNVTLTDLLPANTTFVSFTAPTGWTTSNPSVGATGTVSASITTLAANASATFTLVVQVSSSAQGTTIVNKPSVTYTGTGNPITTSLTQNTTVTAPPTTNITSEVAMFATPIVRDPFAGPGAYVQAVLFVNTSGTAISGPIALVLNNLPAGVTVTNANGTTNGSPYINIEPPGGTWQPGVRYFLTAVIVFSDPTHVKITYTPEVVQGI